MESLSDVVCTTCIKIDTWFDIAACAVENCWDCREDTNQCDWCNDGYALENGRCVGM